MKKVIETRNLCKVYGDTDKTVKALDDVSITVREGEFVAVTGTSGSGKSTLMNILGCLDKQSSGEYYLDGIVAIELCDRELSLIRNEKIGFIFQGFNLIPSLTALENVELPLIYRGIGKQRSREIAEAALQRVGLQNRMNHRPSAMSGGQQQRTAIARALAADPSLILADEPTGNLDSATGAEIMKVLCELNEAGKTIVLITHDQKVAAQAHRTIQIYDGKIV